MSRVVVFLLFLIAIPITNGLNPRKLDEVDENKCGGCPCNKPCVSPSPPPSPPALPPPSPPPPKKPPSAYCPPPPSGGGGSGGGGGGYVPDTPNSQYIYMTGPPGNLYPVDHDFGGAKRSFSSGFSLLIVGFFLGLLSFW
ncbi:PREDICTED: mulatexin-like [Nicotiana attenuata]|uniref:Uncharacterized protein n=1 Tax=Nicotiana attenuata TaxID=49451 RepID=A0A1J6I526_NICAT|nr:PREDICTED: mulatexin-like [Nicotiana attenuata]OIS95663.1 hypothetical protein A4A49_13563 [Nicotiana attenuata]